MLIESNTPKYADIITTLRARIDQGEYRVGALLPSEARLTREFAASRSTVVRALDYLRRHGWVEAIRGKGRIVLGRPASRLAALPRRVQLVLQADRHSPLLSTRPMPASPRIAAALGSPLGAPLIARRYLLRLDGPAPIGLSTVFTPAASAGDPAAPPEGGVLVDLEQRHGMVAHRVVERLGARLSSAGEATALGLDRRRCLAVTLLTVHDPADRPLVAVDAVLSKDIPELASSFLLV